MALTRARPVYGSIEARAEIQGVLDRTLHVARDPGKLVRDAASMRGDIARHKPPEGPLDVKLGEGGLVDLEFAVHVLQLTHRIAFKPRLEQAIAGLIAAELIPPEIADAHYLLARILITLRLVSPDSAIPPEASRPLVARACGKESWDVLLAAQEDARQRVSKLWRSIAAKGEDDAE